LPERILLWWLEREKDLKNKKEAGMKIAGWMKRGCSRTSYRALAFAGGSVLWMALLTAPRLAAQNQHDSRNQDGIGFNLNKGADAKDVGLPWYPGARRHPESKDDSSSVQMGLWGGSTDFRLAALELDSNDSPDKVTAYYRKALSKYGIVLECPGGNTPHEEQDKSKKSEELECDSDKPEKGELELKAGTKEEQHIVGVQKEGTETRIKLVYLKAKGIGDNKK
jgi:hypothetical protein